MSEGRELSSVSGSPGGDRGSAWKMLVKRVVNGSNEERCHASAVFHSVSLQDTYMWIAPTLRESTEKAVEDLMRDLEAWSMELARHCPEAGGLA